MNSLTIDHLEVNDDSVKIFINPYNGAVDYRCYGQDDPHFVKYAGGSGNSATRGIANWTPQAGFTYPAGLPPCIEFNGLTKITNLVVEAVDKLGPYMDPMVYGLPMPVCTTANCGGVLDPLCEDTHSVNGHGIPGTFPLPLARCGIKITPKPIDLPKEGFLDTFSNSQVFTRTTPDPRTIAADPVNCIRFESDKWVCDVFHSGDRSNEVKVFTDHSHLMTVIADGGKTWDADKDNNKVFAGGQGYASFTLRPKHSIDISNNRIAHITGEWDSHNSGRRWQDIFIAPVGDAIIQNAWSEVVLNPMASKNCIAVGIRVNVVQVRQFDIQSANLGTLSPQNTLTYERFAGGTPDAIVGCPLPAFRCTPLQAGTAQIGHNGFDNGHDNDIDNRHQFDIYLSTTEIDVYEQGILKVQWKFPIPLTYTKFDVWFMHHLYHSNNEHTEIVTNYTEQEILWRDRTPYIDQRHWDNLGIEVIDNFTTPKVIGKTQPEYFDISAVPPVIILDPPIIVPTNPFDSPSRTKLTSIIKELQDLLDVLP